MQLFQGPRRQQKDHDDPDCMVVGASKPAVRKLMLTSSDDDFEEDTGKV